MTAQIIKDLSVEGFTPTAIATSISFSVGVYGLIMGLLKLGWLLDFISLPVLTGFVGAAGLTIFIGQVPAVFGQTAGSGKSLAPNYSSNIRHPPRFILNTMFRLHQSRLIVNTT